MARSFALFPEDTLSEEEKLRRKGLLPAKSQVSAVPIVAPRSPWMAQAEKMATPAPGAMDGVVGEFGRGLATGAGNVARNVVSGFPAAPAGRFVVDAARRGVIPATESRIESGAETAGQLLGATKAATGRVLYGPGGFPVTTPVATPTAPVETGGMLKPMTPEIAAQARPTGYPGGTEVAEELKRQRLASIPAGTFRAEGSAGMMAGRLSPGQEVPTGPADVAERRGILAAQEAAGREVTNRSLVADANAAARRKDFMDRTRVPINNPRMPEISYREKVLTAQAQGEAQKGREFELKKQGIVSQGIAGAKRAEQQTEIEKSRIAAEGQRARGEAGGKATVEAARIAAEKGKGSSPSEILKGLNETIAELKAQENPSPEDVARIKSYEARRDEIVMGKSANPDVGVPTIAPGVTAPAAQVTKVTPQEFSRRFQQAKGRLPTQQELDEARRYGRV